MLWTLEASMESKDSFDRHSKFIKNILNFIEKSKKRMSIFFKINDHLLSYGYCF